MQLTVFKASECVDATGSMFTWGKLFGNLASQNLLGGRGLVRVSNKNYPNPLSSFQPVGNNGG